MLFAALVLVLAACTSDDVPEDKRFSEECGSSLQLCADEGLIQARILVKTCTHDDGCRTEPLSQNPFLEFVQLDGPAGERCGPGDCGAAPNALQHGWSAGRWKIIAPPLEGLTEPEPVTIDLQAGELLNVDFVYVDDGVG